MSNKRMMSKQQRLYYEHNNKEKVQKELEEMAKVTNEIQKQKTTLTSFDPHRNSFYY